MRTLMIGSALAVAVTILAGCGGSSASSDRRIERDAALYQIDQIEQTWQRAASTHNVNLMMTLWAPGAVFNIGGEDAQPERRRSGSSSRRRTLRSCRSTTGSPTRPRTRSEQR